MDALFVYRQHVLIYKNINVQNYLFVMNSNSLVPFMSVNVKLEEHVLVTDD